MGEIIRISIGELPKLVEVRLKNGALKSYTMVATSRGGVLLNAATPARETRSTTPKSK